MKWKIMCERQNKEEAEAKVLSSSPWVTGSRSGVRNGAEPHEDL